MNTESGTVKLQFGRNIVTAWFETVINPILQSLSVEMDYLGKAYWTWQTVPGRLESVRKVRDMIPMGYQPNLIQFQKYHPEIKSDIDIHDEAQTVLFVNCKNMERVILDSKALKPIFEEVTTETALSQLGKSKSDLFFGNTSEEEQLGWIAQEIINGTKSLPSFIGHSALWNEHRDRFMSVLGHPDVYAAKVQVDHAGEDLLKKAKHLSDLLSETRDELSLVYDVPPVPVPSSALAA